MRRALCAVWGRDDCTVEILGRVGGACSVILDAWAGAMVDFGGGSIERRLMVELFESLVSLGAGIEGRTIGYSSSESSSARARASWISTGKNEMFSFLTFFSAIIDVKL